MKNKISLGNNLDENNLEEQKNTDNELEVFENDNENNDGNDNQLVHRTKSYIVAIKIIQKIQKQMMQK